MKKAINKLLPALIDFVTQSRSKAVIGFARSLLAADVLLKLLFNDINVLIPADRLTPDMLHSIKYRCNFFLLPGPSHLTGMKFIALLLLGLIIAGYYVKLTCLVHYWLAASLYMFRTGYLGLHSISILLTLLLIPVCVFDERKNHWHAPSAIKTSATLLQNTFLWLIKIQVAFIYYDSFHDKLFSRPWQNGTVIYYWFTHNFFGLHPEIVTILTPALTSIPVLLAITWCTMAFEAVLATGLIFSSRIKLLLLKGGIIFHFSILLIHGFASLFFAMSAALFLYLFPARKTFSLMLYDK